MKTAVSLPDALFHDAERAAKRLGISRSELFQRALAAFLKELDEQAITDSYNEVYGPGGEDSRPDPVLQELSFRTLQRDEW